MKNCSGFGRLFGALAFAGAAAAVALTGCTEVDDTLGDEFIPDDQQMTIARTTIDEGFETRLYHTDSIVSSGLTYGYFGTTCSDTLGIRRAGFLTQYLWQSTTDRANWYGYKPVFDSMCLLLSISNYGGDTLCPQTFEVFEVTSNDYLTDRDGDHDGEKDSIFYLNFDPACAADLSKPLFEFTFPDGRKSGPATTSVRLRPTPEGRAYARRLMLQEGKYGTGDLEKDTMVYNNDSLWVNYFRGLIIRPKSVEGRGAVFAASLSSSGMTLYARNRDSIDANLIHDTISTDFLFTPQSGYYGSVAITSATHTDGSAPNAVRYAEIGESVVDRPIARTAYMAPFGGPLVEITLTDDFLDRLGTLQDGTGYKALGINQALLYIYVEGVTDEGWEQHFPSSVIEWFDASPVRAGLYTDYKKLTPVTDYDYLSEMQGSEIGYNGYLNRSQGCYIMNIPAHMQQLWNSYREHRADGEYTDAQKALRTLYFAPEAGESGRFGFGQTALQGTGSPVKIRLEITYTMVR